MTICIAAIADWWHDPKIVLCSDTRIEMQDFTSANTGNKLGWVAKHWLALLAGNLPHAKELVTYYQDHLANEPESSEVSGTISQFRIPPQNMKNARIEQHLQMKWGMSYDDFTTKGSQAIPQDLYQATWREIESIQLQCELILAGFIGTRAHLFSYDDQFNAVHCEHFATIGSGSWIAKAALFQRGCHDQMSLEEVVYYVYEAKRLSEIAPGVGKETKMVMIAYHPEGVNPRLTPLDGSEWKALETCYRKFGLKKFKRQDLAIAPPPAESRTATQ